jgi:hypothetical protein
MDVKGLKIDFVYWINLAHDKIQWLDLVNIVIKPRVK